MNKNINLEQVQKKINKGDSFVLNLTASWCSDCTEQSSNLSAFNETLAVKNITVYSLMVQEQKNIYLSSEHQYFTESVGGHGFPRTLLIINGEVVDADNVEIIAIEQLNKLAQKFLTQI